jgi:hypothetical protein
LINWDFAKLEAPLAEPFGYVMHFLKDSPMARMENSIEVDTRKESEIRPVLCQERLS